MAFDADEFNNRRERRQRAQQQRELRRRALMVRLIIASAVLVVCAVAIFAAVRNARRNAQPAPSQPSAPTQSGAPSTSAPSAPTEPEPTEPTTTIHFAAAGDLIVCDETVASGGTAYQYAPVFQNVMPLLAAADLSAVSFEGNIVGQPYGTATSSAPAQLLSALSGAGVDFIQLANSASIANGLTGLSATIQAVRDAGMEPLGAYATNQDADRSGGYVIRQVRGVKVALVAFTKGMDSMALPDGSERCVNLLYRDYATTYQEVDEGRITGILDAVAAEEPDITIALLHWGSEFNDMRSPSQKKIRELMLSHGVDAIIGTHPHYVQPVEYDSEAGTLVCYSLGDFLGSAERTGTNYSIAIDLTITKDNATGQTRLTGYTVTPLYLLRENGGTRIVQIRQELANFEANFVGKVSQEVYDEMTACLTRSGERTSPTFVDEE